MATRLAFAIATGLALGGCCHNIGSYVPPSNAHAEFGPLSKPLHVKRAISRHISNTAAASKAISQSGDKLSNPDPDSKEWHDAPDAINSAADDGLKQKLVICRGCEQPAPDDPSSSIWPTRGAEGYLSIQRTLRSLSLPVETSSSSGLR
jgi:hypothetical protein